MIQDLHSHTYYSFCGKDSPEAIVEAAIDGGIELFGICDHNHGIGFGRKDAFKAPPEVIPNEYSPVSLRRYYDHIALVKEKYADRIRVLCGIEITAHLNIPKIALPADADVSFFDYCMIENPDEDPYRYFRRMAEQNIFWEMNVSYDSIHKYREHPYMLAFFQNPEQQAIVRESGVRLSVGFDGHRVWDYLPDRVAGYCKKLTELGIKMPFEE